MTLRLAIALLVVLFVLQGVTGQCPNGRKKRSFVDADQLNALNITDRLEPPEYVEQSDSVNISCSLLSVNMSFSHAYLVGFDVASIKELVLLDKDYEPINDSSCRAVSEDSFYKFSMIKTFAKCANNVRLHNSILLVNYTVLVVPDEQQGVVSRKPTNFIQLSCAYRRDLNMTFGERTNVTIPITRRCINVARRWHQVFIDIQGRRVRQKRHPEPDFVVWLWLNLRRVQRWRPCIRKIIRVRKVCNEHALACLYSVTGQCPNGRKKRSFVDADSLNITDRLEPPDYVEQSDSVNISCSLLSVNMSFSHAYLAGFDVASIKELVLLDKDYEPINDSSCRAVSEDSFYKFSFVKTFAKCSNNVKLHNSILLVNYTVLVVPDEQQGVVSRKPTNFIQLSCAYRRDLNMTFGERTNITIP
ncbi:uncharacterized protein LOC100186813 [Ciona intestinalis]